jgi:hypothetical protein
MTDEGCIWLTFARREGRGAGSSLRPSPHDEERIVAARDGVGQRRIRRFLREVALASEDLTEPLTYQRGLLALRDADTPPEAAMDAAHDLVLRRRFEAGRTVVDGDRGEASTPGRRAALASSQVGKVDRDRLGSRRLVVMANSPAERRKIAPAGGLGPLGLLLLLGGPRGATPQW